MSAAPAKSVSVGDVVENGAHIGSIATSRRALDWRAVSLVLALCLVWGFQPVAMKGIASQVAPAMQLAVRFAGAALFFGLWVSFTEGRRAFRDGTLPSGLLLGLLFSLEFVLMGESLIYTSAAHSVVFLYTAPIFAALGLKVIPEERLSRLQWSGIGIAFFGIVVAFFGFGGPSDLKSLAGDALALLAGVSWGFSNVVLRRGKVHRAATVKTVLYQVGTAAVVLAAFAGWSGQAHWQSSGWTLASMAFQTFIIAIGSYLVWFWLLGRYLTSRLLLLSLLTPLFGVLCGAAFLGDAIEPRFAFGAGFVLAGVLIVNLQLLRQAAPTASS